MCYYALSELICADSLGGSLCGLAAMWGQSTPYSIRRRLTNLSSLAAHWSRNGETLILCYLQSSHPASSLLLTYTHTPTKVMLGISCSFLDVISLANQFCSPENVTSQTTFCHLCSLYKWLPVSHTHKALIKKQNISEQYMWLFCTIPYFNSWLRQSLLSFTPCILSNYWYLHNINNSW